jgi:putative transposase
MHDERIASDRRYLSDESLALLTTTLETGEHAAIESGK